MNDNHLFYLKTLGYRKTVEDGAILEHPDFYGIDRYVWHDDVFTNMLNKYPERLKNSIINKIITSIREG